MTEDEILLTVMELVTRTAQAQGRSFRVTTRMPDERTITVGFLLPDGRRNDIADLHPLEETVTLQQVQEILDLMESLWEVYQQGGQPQGEAAPPSPNFSTEKPTEAQLKSRENEISRAASIQMGDERRQLEEILKTAPKVTYFQDHDDVILFRGLIHYPLPAGEIEIPAPIAYDLMNAQKAKREVNAKLARWSRGLQAQDLDIDLGIDHGMPPKIELAG